MNRKIEASLLRGDGVKMSPGKRSPGLFVFLAACLLLVPCSLQAARYGFESGKDGWAAQNWGAGKDKCTNVAQSSFWGFGGSTNSLRMDCVRS